MKTYPNILKPVKHHILIILLIFTALIGLTLNANAQSTLIKNDLEKINSSMIIQLKDYDFDILIPKMSTEELNNIKDAIFNQLVYVADGSRGYYFYMGAQWEKQNVREVFELIDINLMIQEPNMESLIVMAGEDSYQLLDYNLHIKNIYKNFGFDRKDNAMAINIERK